CAKQGIHHKVYGVRNDFRQRLYLSTPLSGVPCSIPSYRPHLTGKGNLNLPASRFQQPGYHETVSTTIAWPACHHHPPPPRPTVLNSLGNGGTRIFHEHSSCNACSNSSVIHAGHLGRREQTNGTI